MKHSWVMYAFLIILVTVLVKNAAGSVGVILAGKQLTTGTISAFEGTGSNTKGTFGSGANMIKLG